MIQLKKMPGRPGRGGPPEGTGGCRDRRHPPIRQLPLRRLEGGVADPPDGSLPPVQPRVRRQHGGRSAVLLSPAGPAGRARALLYYEGDNDIPMGYTPGEVWELTRRVLSWARTDAGGRLPVVLLGLKHAPAWPLSVLSRTSITLGSAPPPRRTRIPSMSTRPPSSRMRRECEDGALQRRPAASE